LDLIFKELKGKQALIEASKELDDATKKTLLAQVDQAIQFAKLAEHEQLSRKLTEMIERTKKRLDALNKEIESLKGITESGFTEETRQLSLLAEHAKGQAELVLYEQQLTGHGIISSLLTAERDLADRAVAKQDSKVKTWLNLLQERNRAEAAQALEQAEEAKQKATELPPPIQEQFDTNIAMSAKLEALTQEEMHLLKKLEYIKTQRKEFEAEFALDSQYQTPQPIGSFLNHNCFGLVYRC
jgi:hypothetical protein